jgi:signal transduction histidine kinase
VTTAALEPDLGAVPVLVVDDRADNILAVEAVLEPLDVEIVRATSGADALRCLLTGEVAVILLDVQMPELDGFETARHIKERARTSHIPIIFLTAISREIEQQLKGYGAGAVDYLSKPFEPEVLRSKVAVFAELYRNRKLIEHQNELLALRLDELDRASASLARQTIELERSNAELDRLGTLASHELREPLFVVDGFLELLAARHAGALGADGVAMVGQARAGAQRLLGKIDEVLGYARVSGSASEREHVDLDTVVDAARRELDSMLRRADAVVSADDLPVVDGDRWQLERLFVHLLDNAVRYRGADPPQIDVSAERDGMFWTVSVRDNGRGIGPDVLPRLFTPLPDPVHGDGAARLGLTLCQRVVERHGGTIWAASDEHGTTVSFTLPAVASDAADETTR